MAKTIRLTSIIFLVAALSGCVGCGTGVEPIIIQEPNGKLRTDGLMLTYHCKGLKYGE